jgi:hypothetical protein
MIYALSPDNTHLKEEDELVFDAVLIEFDGFANVQFFHPDVDYQQRFSAPAVIEFVGNLENAAWLDHIETSPIRFMLLSKRMVRVLESVKPFRHRLIPTTIYSDEIEQRVRKRSTRRRTRHQVQEPELRNDDFVILQLLNQVDCLDRERTKVAGVPFHHSGKKYLGKDDAEHLELRTPASGFPPVFFVPELLYYCFTEEAKQACDKAGLKGLRWRPQP